MEEEQKERIADELVRRIVVAMTGWFKDYSDQSRDDRGSAAVVALARSFAILLTETEGTPADYAALKGGAHPSEFPAVERDNERASEFAGWLLNVVSDKLDEMKRGEG